MCVSSSRNKKAGTWDFCKHRFYRCREDWQPLPRLIKTAEENNDRALWSCFPFRFDLGLLEEMSINPIGDNHRIATVMFNKCPACFC